LLDSSLPSGEIKGRNLLLGLNIITILLDILNRDLLRSAGGGKPTQDTQRGRNELLRVAPQFPVQIGPRLFSTFTYGEVRKIYGSSVESERRLGKRGFMHFTTSYRTFLRSSQGRVKRL